MLGESVEGFHKLEEQYEWHHFPYAYVLCIVGILGTLFVERISVSFHSHALDETSYHHDHGHKPGDIPSSTNNSVNLYALAILLSVHSLVEGVALGVEKTVADTTNVFVAIIGHKFFDSFAVGVNMAKSSTSPRQLIKVMFLFAAATPIGILFGMWSLNTASNGIASEVVKALSSGTFIYIGLVEVIVEEFENPRDKYLKFVCLILGVLVMCWVNTAGEHHH